MRVLGLILCGSNQDNLKPLTRIRTSAAVPMFGKYRAIDFTLSNMVNSGISKVGVLTQYNPRSLMDHLAGGKEWNLDRKRGGIFILQPFMVGSGESIYYKGTADAIFQNISLLRKGDEDFVLIGSGDHIYNMSYMDLFKYHIRKGADITVISSKICREDSRICDYGQLAVDNDGRISEFVEKPTDCIYEDISMGVYFINKALLLELLYSSVPNNGYDMVRDIIIPNISKLRVYAYKHSGYWRNIKKSIKEYYDTNMDILKREVRKELFYSGRKIYTKLKDYAPPKININACVSNSLIADGCIVNGQVKNSIISRGVIIKAGASVENSIIMEDSVIEEGAILKNAILDKSVTLRNAKRIEGIGEILTIEKDSVI
jgi:glucose-1-phosphate adenylyltransferase